MDNFISKKECCRCGKKLVSRTMSMFNEDIICLECKEEERKHPMYKKARDAEKEQIALGNLNYEGLFAGQKYPFDNK